ncbi:hypothetical protein [Neorhodopirellula lusitana]|uniref:hypothetical protein n=1 Tax=Neorhodopirellula lusitana TaxID=445327 RepID=UPI00384DD31D
MNIEMESAWPQSNDKLFSNSGSYEKTAIVGRHWADWMIMAEGYIRSAELAVEHCGRFDRNLIVYPVVFQCRHGIELALKRTLVSALRLFDEPVDLPLHHRVLDTWRLLRPHLESLWPNSDGKDLRSVECMIKELHKADQNAETFRYPVGKKGKSHHKTDRDIDLEVFVESARKIFNFLNASHDGISDALESKLDAERDARENMG